MNFIWCLRLLSLVIARRISRWIKKCDEKWTDTNIGGRRFECLLYWNCRAMGYSIWQSILYCYCRMKQEWLDNKVPIIYYFSFVCLCVLWMKLFFSGIFVSSKNACALERLRGCFKQCIDHRQLVWPRAIPTRIYHRSRRILLSRLLQYASQ